VGMNCQNVNELTVNGSVVATQSVSANALTVTSGANSGTLTCGGSGVVTTPSLAASVSVTSPFVGVNSGGSNNVGLSCASPNVLLVGAGAGSVQANVYLGGLYGHMLNLGAPGLLITGQQTVNITFPFPGYTNAAVFVFTFQPLTNNATPCIVYGYSFVSQDIAGNTATLAVSFDAYSANPSSLGFLNIVGVNPGIY